MSDSFADLWNTTAGSSVKSPPPPRTLGAGPPSVSSSNTRRPQPDAFSLLASSAPNSRPITPGSSSTFRSPISSQSNLAKAPQRSGSAAGGTRNGQDAFSDLLGGSIGASINGKNLTMAERAARFEKSKAAPTSLSTSGSATSSLGSSAWAGLDMLASSPAPSNTRASEKKMGGMNEFDLLGGSNGVDDDWGLMTAPVAPALMKSTKTPPVVKDDLWEFNSEGLTTQATPTHDDDLWGLPSSGNVVPTSNTNSTTKHAGKPTKIATLDDLWESASRSPSPSHNSSSRPARTNSPGEFDFGDREDRLLDDDDDSSNGVQDEDDILGVLSKPVEAVQRRQQKPSLRPNDTPTVLPSVKPVSRPPSPPPHILGQIVEMGFSIQQARIALAATDTGLDVQAAIESLISNGAAGVADEQPPLPRRREPTQGRRVAQRTREEIPSPHGQQQERESGIQADKLLAQASEIGLSVFNKANMFWNQGKEKVQKVYEERAGALAPSGSGSGASGSRAGPTRPKWMQDQRADGDDDGVEDDGWGRGKAGKVGFSDEPESPEGQYPHARQRKPKPEPPKVASKPDSVNLFGDEPVAYVSPFRRGGKPKTSASENTLATPPPPMLASSSSSSLSRHRQRTPSPVRAQPRSNVVTASSSAISRSSSHKLAGTEKYKLGQYSVAESSYTLAIDCLPASHLLLVPLYNNRALTRLKIGDYKGVIEDGDMVVQIVGEGYHPMREAKVRGGEEVGGGVDLADGLVKAWKRRAEAWEGRERWNEAGRDWEKVAAAEWAAAAVRNEAVRGVGRCRRMADGGTGGQEIKVASTPKQAPPRARPPPASLPRNGAAGKALTNLRNANNVAEAEDQQRYELKDSVDAKLLAWKGGKEANIRALLGSLETVLWPESGLQKVGMADLVSPNQVKIRYTKTIAKLHPDKLTPSNTTVEQRMIANGVFGALNEAWNAFKA